MLRASRRGELLFSFYFFYDRFTTVCKAVSMNLSLGFAQPGKAYIGGGKKIEISPMLGGSNMECAGASPRIECPVYGRTITTSPFSEGPLLHRGGLPASSSHVRTVTGFCRGHGFTREGHAPGHPSSRGGLLGAILADSHPPSAASPWKCRAAAGA